VIGAVTAVQVGSSPRCRSCEAPIWFGLTAKGKRMPLDPAPVEDGNVVMDRLEQVMDQLAGADESGPGQALPHIRVLSKGELPDPDVARYVSHFATCPKADRHRRPREERAKARNKSKARAMGLETRP
jgi:hypothetical protein